jgi:hypothetical protein
VACVGWIFFRASSVEVAWTLVSRLPGILGNALPAYEQLRPAVYPIALCVLWEWWNRHDLHGLVLRRISPVGRFAIAVALLAMVAAHGQVRTVPFIYFQF